MQGHRRIQDLTARIGEQRLPERGGGIAQRKRALGEPPQGGLDEREIEEEEVPLVERKRAQENGGAEKKLVESEGREQREGCRARSFAKVGGQGIQALFDRLGASDPGKLNATVR